MWTASKYLSVSSQNGQEWHEDAQATVEVYNRHTMAVLGPVSTLRDLG